MPAKITAARRAAFMAALAETGNQSLAAERAKVSGTWVRHHRKTDPDFRRESDAAVRQARDRLRSVASLKPAAGWRSQAGEELVVRGTPGRAVQIARARLHQWTPRVEARFLAVLAASCNVRAACRAVGMTPPAAYYHYRRRDDFAKSWDAALETGYDRLEMALVENACRSLGPAPDYPPDIPIAPMTFEDALRLLRLNTARVHGRPVKHGENPRGAMSPDEVNDELMKRLAAKGREARRLAGDAEDEGATRE